MTPDVDCATAFTTLSLCAGVGGLDLGLALAIPHARTLCYVEREAACIETLATRMEEGHLDAAPIWTDVTTFSGRPWRGLVDCLVGGYPCQPFSLAGRRQGKADPRHLWPHVARIVDEVEPAWCLFENVGAHLRMGYRRVRADLHGLGYRVAAGLFTAAEVGAPHQRERLFIVAHADQFREHTPIHERRPPEDWDQADGRSQTMGDATSRRTQSIQQSRSICGARPANEDMVNADLTRLEGSAPSFQSRADERPAWPPGPEDDVAWRTVISVCPELAPALEPALRGVADGLAPRVDRLRACGNGVVPRVAAYAFRELATALLAKDKR